MLLSIICIIVVIFGMVCWIIDLFDDSEAKYRAEQEFRRVEDKKNYSELTTYYQSEKLLNINTYYEDDN